MLQGQSVHACQTVPKQVTAHGTSGRHLSRNRTMMRGPGTSVNVTGVSLRQVYRHTNKFSGWLQQYVYLQQCMPHSTRTTHAAGAPIYRASSLHDGSHMQHRKPCCPALLNRVLATNAAPLGAQPRMSPTTSPTQSSPEPDSSDNPKLRGRLGSIAAQHGET